jgi:hypothetical protein
LVSFFGCSATLLFAIAAAGSAAARIGGNASDGGGGTHGASAERTTVFGGGWYAASPGFAVTVGCINQKRPTKKPRYAATTSPTAAAKW